MRFKTVVIAAVILAVAAAGGLAAFQIAGDARGETAQTTVEQTDSLAVEPDIRQTLTAKENHTPTRYGETITVVYNGTVLEPEGNYTYYQSEGEIEFLTDEPNPADIDYSYDIPRDQLADDQLTTVVESYGNVLLLGGGLTFVVLLLFIGGFMAKKIGIGTTSTRGR